MALFSSVARAAGSDVLVVTMRDSHKATFSLGDKPEISFRADVMVLTADGEADRLEVHMADVVSLTFTDVTAAETPVADLNVSYSGGRLEVDGLAAGTPLEVYDQSGRLVAAVKADSEGHAAADLTQAPAGVYVARAGASVWKIVRR